MIQRYRFDLCAPATTRQSVSQNWLDMPNKQSVKINVPLTFFGFCSQLTLFYNVSLTNIHFLLLESQVSTVIWRKSTYAVVPT